MRMLWTLDELVSARTNGWSCPDCGRLWMDAAPAGALAIPITSTETPCSHPKLMRALVAPPRHGKTGLVTDALNHLMGVPYAR